MWKGAGRGPGGRGGGGGEGGGAEGWGGAPSGLLDLPLARPVMAMSSRVVGEKLA